MRTVLSSPQGSMIPPQAAISLRSISTAAPPPAMVVAFHHIMSIVWLVAADDTSWVCVLFSGIVPVVAMSNRRVAVTDMTDLTLPLRVISTTIIYTPKPWGRAVS